MKKNMLKVFALALTAVLVAGVPSQSAITANAKITTTKLGQSEGELPEGWRSYGSFSGASYYGTDAEITIPPQITELGQFAIYDNPYVQVIHVPATVTNIGGFSIYELPNLRYIIFEGDTQLEEYAIRNCANLKNIVTPFKNSSAESMADSLGVAVTRTIKEGFAKKNIYLLVGDKFNQPVCNTIYDDYVWTSSKKSVVTVDAAGRIKAKKPGKAVITATNAYGTFKYKVNVYKKNVQNRVKQVKNLTISKKMSDYEKVKAVHNWMIRNISYDYKNYLKGTLPRKVYTVEGALLDKKCVCQGYALAFKKLMDEYGVACVVVRGMTTGGGHAWNMVKIGGKWYHIDVTWDDPITDGTGVNTKIYYTYFLKSTSYMNKHEHTFTIRSYPRCNSKKYD
ncbi:transglutaminase domain-containing protein [Butyrivibrio sp. AE3006]|uniref:transglutaminase domain-containing protein n=1 Tax=Butyrivibrio sp. AE3006 TaxID=1280673 RepID=UPI0004000B90|nr:transglutaminase domain-containing protein [Butyrivibrio sp. AE3006]